MKIYIIFVDILIIKLYYIFINIILFIILMEEF